MLIQEWLRIQVREALDEGIRSLPEEGQNIRIVDKIIKHTIPQGEGAICPNHGATFCLPSCLTLQDSREQSRKAGKGVQADLIFAPASRSSMREGFWMLLECMA